tara:strand:- start:706 stop:900 length:195 start_codon:yes stop_codon:yes gene_type:complete
MQDEKQRDDRVCLFYVTQRLEGILTEDGLAYGMETCLRDFHRECLRNLGVNALRNYEENVNEEV